MTLAELIAPCEQSGEVMRRQGSLDVSVSAVTDDSRHVRPGTVFVAVQGERDNGHAYLARAMEAGAAALIVQDASCLDTSNIPAVAVRNTRQALGALASRVLGDPSGKLRMIGVTGTNGKTTT